MKKRTFFLPSILLVFFLMPHFVHADISSGLVGWWKFDEGSGTTEYDSSGYHNTATTTGTVLWVPGKFGTALQFGGPKSIPNYVAAPGSPSIDNLLNKTVCAWIYATTTPPGNTQALIVSKVNLAAGSGWWLYYDAYAYGTSTFEFEEDGYGNQWNDWAATTTSITLNTWTDVCASENVSSVANTPSLYVNAVPQTVYEYYAGSPGGAAYDESGNPIEIGGFPIAGYYDNFPGYIDDVRLYDRILTPTDVKQVYLYGQFSNFFVSLKNFIIRTGTNFIVH